MRSQQNMPIDACYFLTFNVIDWISVFIRPAYKRIIVDSLNYFVQARGVTIYSWCLMSNHLHLLAKTEEDYGMANFERDFKKFTTVKVLAAIGTEPDLRREWMLRHFEDFSKSLRKIEKLHVWQNCSSPVHVDCKQRDVLQQRIVSIHENPVRDGIVDLPENYLFSSARDYTGMKGLVQVRVLRQGLPGINKLTAN